MPSDVSAHGLDREPVHLAPVAIIRLWCHAATATILAEIARFLRSMNVPMPHLPPGSRSVSPLAPSLERLRLRISLTLVLLDVLAIYAGFLLVGGAYLGEFPAELAVRKAVMVAPLFVIFGAHNGFYNSQLIFSIRKTFLLCIYGFVLSALFTLFITFYAKSTEEFSRVVFTLGSALSAGLIIAFRWLVKQWVGRTIGPSLQNTIVIHAGGPAVPMDHAYHIDARTHGLSSDRNDPQNLDRLGCYTQNMDRVIISCPHDDREQWTPLLRAAGVRGEFVSDALRRLGALKIQNEPGFLSVVVSTKPFGIEARLAKRLMDVTISSAAALLLAPLMIGVAIFIKMEDGGAVLFKQRRMGRGNRFFWIYKFCSMRAEACDADATRLTSRDDDRATRIGKFIRRTSIDELPQLYNVWRGDMSLVGPRPHALGALAGERLYWEVDGRYWNRHVLKPGLTGLAQVSGFRGNTESEQHLADRLRADFEYIAKWSLWLDVKIMLKTIRVLAHSNAY